MHYCKCMVLLRIMHIFKIDKSFVLKNYITMEHRNIMYAKWDNALENFNIIVIIAQIHVI